MEKGYKFYNSRRPRHRAMPETYMWEKIFKKYHQARPQDKRRRYWEFGKKLNISVKEKMKETKFTGY